MPQIAVINESTDIADTAVQGMLDAFGQQWNKDLQPVWGVDTATFIFVPKGNQPAAGSWWLVFLDNSDQARALAYHDLTDEGLPISKVRASASRGISKRFSEAALAGTWGRSAAGEDRLDFWRD